MTVDRYTKGVLTVIAGCLLWMCAMWAPGTVLAQQGARELTTVSHYAQPVVLVGIGAMDSDGKVMVYYATHNGRQWTDPTVPIHAASPLAVSLPYTPANPLPAQLGYTPAAPLPGIAWRAISKNSPRASRPVSIRRSASLRRQRSSRPRMGSSSWRR